MSREERSKKCMVQKKSLIWSVIGKLSKWREKVTSHAQNLHLKLRQLAPSFESILAVWLKKPFFKNNTFLFFYIESSSFQHLIEFCETFKISTHSAYSDNCYFHFFYGLSDWVEILWGFTKFVFKQILKVLAFYLEKQKSFIPN